MSTGRPDPNRPEKPLKIQAGGVKKAKNQGLKVVTANDLFTGRVVYWTSDGTWADDLDEAGIFEGQAALDALGAATRDEACSVGPYLMDVEAGPAPAGRGRLREEIREAGPSIHPQFGRQGERDRH